MRSGSVEKAGRGRPGLRVVKQHCSAPRLSPFGLKETHPLSEGGSGKKPREAWMLSARGTGLTISGSWKLIDESVFSNEYGVWYIEGLARTHVRQTPTGSGRRHDAGVKLVLVPESGPPPMIEEAQLRAEARVVTHAGPVRGGGGRGVGPGGRRGDGGSECGGGGGTSKLSGGK